MSNNKTFYSELTTTPCFRLSFAKGLTQPETKKGADGNEYREWSALMMFPKSEDLTSLYKAYNEVMAQMYGPDPSKWPSAFKNPTFRDGDSDPTYLLKPDTYGILRGHIAVRMSATKQPGFVYGDGLTTIVNMDDIYSGMWARAQVCAQNFSFEGNVGIKFIVYNLQKWKDDERIGGFSAPPATEAFGAIPGSSLPTPGPQGFTPVPPAQYGQPPQPAPAQYGQPPQPAPAQYGQPPQPAPAVPAPGPQGGLPPTNFG